MKRDKILILGAGNSQVDAIEYCKSQGLFVAGCSYTNTDKGIPLLDDFRQIDIKDIDAVVLYATDIKASSIYSVGSDLAVPTVMRASEILKLPHFISYESAMLCHSKHLMREALGHDFIGNIDYVVCETVEDAMLYNKYPAMMKPVDSQGQRGCFRVDSIQDVADLFNNSLLYSVCGKVIIESFIDGPEISVNSYRENGKTNFALVSDREVFNEYPGGLVRSHRIPSIFANDETRTEAVEIVDRAADKLGITDGPCYCQMKIGSDGHPYILEIAPRLDGCHMWNLIKHATGINLLELCFKHLIEGGAGIDAGFVDEIKPYELEFICEQNGATFDESRHSTLGAEYCRMYYENGDTVQKVNGYYEKCGYIIKPLAEE